MKSFFLAGIGFCLLLVAACEPANQPLPTLVRFPSETPVTANNETLVAEVRNTLPPTFTPTHTATLAQNQTATPATTEAAAAEPQSSITPSATITNTPSATPTDLPTISPEDRPLLALALTALASTVLPTDFVVPPYQGINVTLAPTQYATLAPGMPSPIAPLGQQLPPVNVGVPAPACTVLPPGGFGTVFSTNPDIAAQLGCPLSAAVQTVPAAWQDFQQGILVWVNGEMLVFYSVTDTWQRFEDTFVQGVDPETTTETPPAGLVAPVRGFLKLWNSNPQVRNTIGWGLAPESGVTATVLSFSGGRMIWLPGRSDMLVLIGSSSGQWRSFAGSF